MSKHSFQKQLRRKTKGRERRLAAIKQLGGVCVMCGESDPLRLDFDHIDRKTKLFDLADAWMRYTLPRIDAEVAKCQLLCKECHKAKNALERPPKPVKTPKRRGRPPNPLKVIKPKTGRPYIRGRACGTISKYTSGCRCQGCRAASKAYRRDYYLKNRDRMLEYSRIRVAEVRGKDPRYIVK